MVAIVFLIDNYCLMVGMPWVSQYKPSLQYISLPLLPENLEPPCPVSDMRGDSLEKGTGIDNALESVKKGLARLTTRGDNMKYEFERRRN